MARIAACTVKQEEDEAARLAAEKFDQELAASRSRNGGGGRELTIRAAS